MPEGGDRHPRRDAQRNRALLVAAAEAVFEEEGIDASVDHITERAGLGTGTLYRHFPTREALVDALFEEHGEELVAVARRALELEDAAEALRRLFDEVISLQGSHRVLRELVLRQSPRPGLVGEARAELARMSEQLVARARVQGVVRDDFTVADLMVLFWSLRPIVEATLEIAPEAWRRHLGFVLDGLRPEAASAAAAAPLSSDELAQASQCLRERRLRHMS
jgi:AcrR family transcriptional regulator